jgi:hypothetical protein
MHPGKKAACSSEMTAERQNNVGKLYHIDAPVWTCYSLSIQGFYFVRSQETILLLGGSCGAKKRTLGEFYSQESPFLITSYYTESIMLNDFEQTLQRVAVIWQELTGCELSIWKPGSSLPVFIPPSVREWSEQARAEHFARLQSDGTQWLAARSRRTPPDFFLASRDPGGSAAGVLGLLADLLNQLDEEQRANQQFSQELLISWNRLSFLIELARIAVQENEQPVIFTRLARALMQITTVQDICLLLANVQVPHRRKSPELEQRLNQFSRSVIFSAPNEPASGLARDLPQVVTWCCAFR